MLIKDTWKYSFIASIYLCNKMARCSCSFSYPVEFEILEVVALDRVEFELVVVGGIGASRNATAVCIGNDITPIVRPIRTNVIVETNTIINVVLSLISIRKVTLARLKYFQYVFRVFDR